MKKDAYLSLYFIDGKKSILRVGLIALIAVTIGLLYFFNSYPSYVPIVALFALGALLVSWSIREMGKFHEHEIKVNRERISMREAEIAAWIIINNLFSSAVSRMCNGENSTIDVSMGGFQGYQLLTRVVGESLNREFYITHSEHLPDELKSVYSAQFRDLKRIDRLILNASILAYEVYCESYKFNVPNNICMDTDKAPVEVSSLAALVEVMDERYALKRRIKSAEGEL